MDLSDFTENLEACKSNYLLNHVGNVDVANSVTISRTRVFRLHVNVSVAAVLFVARITPAQTYGKETDGCARTRVFQLLVNVTATVVSVLQISRTQIYGKEMDRRTS